MGMSWWEIGLFLGNRSVALAFLVPAGRTWVVLPRSCPSPLALRPLPTCGSSCVDTPGTRCPLSLCVMLMAPRTRPSGLTQVCVCLLYSARHDVLRVHPSWSILPSSQPDPALPTQPALRQGLHPDFCLPPVLCPQHPQLTLDALVLQLGHLHDACVSHTLPCSGLTSDLRPCASSAGPSHTPPLQRRSPAGFSHGMRVWRPWGTQI